MREEEKLRTYWVSFPGSPHLPFGIGVTAYSQRDAFALIVERSIDWHLQANEVKVSVDISIQDLDQRHVVPNMGPMQFRGVWYPCLNIGLGAPAGSEYKKLPQNT